MKKLGQRILRSTIARNAASLYLVQACRKLFPLLTLPFLARVLGPSGWGDVAFTQAMGDCIAIFIEFGFGLSATRDLAQHRSSKEACGAITVGTFSTQATLALFSVLVALAVSRWIPLLHSHPKLLCAGLLYGVAQGMVPIWLYQGIERMAIPAYLEVTGKFIALVGLFIFVRSVNDSWRVLALQSVSPVLSLLFGVALAHRMLGLYIPNPRMVKETIIKSWRMFLLRSGIVAYSTANVFIIAMFAPARIVGFYASAEKLAQAVTGLLVPIREAFFPRLSMLATTAGDDSRRLTRLSATIEISFGFILAVISFFAAPLIIQLVFGKSFTAAVPILRILAVLPLIVSVTDAIGFQNLLPAGKESLVTAAIAVGGVVNVALAVLLAPRYLAEGMAVSVAIAEASVAAVLIYLTARTTNFFQRNPATYPKVETLRVPLTEIHTRTGE